MLQAINAQVMNSEYPGWKQLSRDFKYVCELLRLCLTTKKGHPFRTLHFNFDIVEENYRQQLAIAMRGDHTGYSFFPDQLFELFRNGTTIAIGMYVEVAPYERAVGAERLQVVLDWAERAGSLIYEKSGHSPRPFAVAAQRLRVLGFTPSLILGPLRSSPDRKMKGTMEVEMTTEQFTYKYLFLDRKGDVLKRIPCKSVRRQYGQHEFLTSTGDWAWLSNEEFVFTSWGGSPCWTISLRDETVKKISVVSKRIGPSIGRQSFPRVVLWEGFWKHMGMEH